VSFQTLQTIGLVLWIVVGLCLIAVVLVAVPALRELHKWLKGSSELGEVARALKPGAETLTKAADNINYLTAAFRSDADDVGRTIRNATDSANQIIDATRERAAEIHGFLDVVQEEAETTFLNTASLLRGVRARRPKREKREEESSERRRLG
jgi:methyl-accepting chemotaxis protein